MDNINKIDDNKINNDNINNNESIVWERGYKGFKNDLTANQNDFQFEIGKTYHYYPNIKSIQLCKRGFHFCRNFHDVMEYYDISDNERYRYCEIEYDSRDSKVIHGGGKSVTSSIKIVKELSEKEIQELLKGKYEVYRNEVTKDLHRDNDLPAIIYYDENGRVRQEEWWINGKLRRENDLSAVIWYYENGSKWYEKWYVSGVNQRLHRENDLPALIWYYENGNVSGKKWYINGVNQRLNRDNDLPALIHYYRNGSKQYEEWWINGLRSRDRGNDLPAYIYYYENGTKMSEKWYINGVFIK